ncbi:MAG TPA: alanine racemase [Chthoniobacterales bacterium]
MFHSSRCVASIDNAALRHNLDVIRTRIGPKPGIIAIVKADAYGHGVAGLIPVLADKISIFGVANLQEAFDVRAALPTAEVLLLGINLPEERPVAVQHDFQVVVSSIEEARAYARLGSISHPVRVHIAVDTGMGRMGFLEPEIEGAVRTIAALPSLKIAAVATHLPVADEDADFTRNQLDRYEAVIARVRHLLPETAQSHALNSAGILGFPEHAPDFVRAGLALYGSSPLPEFQKDLRAVMTLVSRITLIRELPAGHGVSYGRSFITSRLTRVATISAGYADGYQRRLSNREAAVLIHGHRCPVLGRVTMDQIMVDVTDVSAAAVGDEVILFGQDLPAAELAQKADTIPWEIFTGISKRVQRVYK